VVGGGIAGVSCAQELSRLSPNTEVTLVSQTEVLREILFSNRLTENLEDVSVTENTIEELGRKYPNIFVIVGKMAGLDTDRSIVSLEDGRTLLYVFCYTIVLPSFPVCDVSVSLLSI
jgi:NADH dehydrogenase FAD-containing subunit